MKDPAALKRKQQRREEMEKQAEARDDGGPQMRVSNSDLFRLSSTVRFVNRFVEKSTVYFVWFRCPYGHKQFQYLWLF